MGKGSLRRALAAIAVGALASTTFACGPSFQAIYEGNSRFEHCYALEESAQTSMTEKADCWREWSERYTYGQTRDRIHYATARYVALSQAPNAPTDEALMMAAPGMAPRQSTITAPAPTNPLAPPPKVLDEASAAAALRASAESHPPGSVLGGGPAQASPATAPATANAKTAEPPPPPPLPLPASDCGAGCGRTFHDCAAGACAKGDAGADGGNAKGDAGAGKGGAGAGACAACEKTYRACMRGCFK